MEGASRVRPTDRKFVTRSLSAKLCLASSAVAMILSGCVGPVFKKPKPWVPPQFSSSTRWDGVASKPIEKPFDAEWWRLFNDPLLTKLEAQLVFANLDFERATTQLAQSRAQLLIAGAERYPGVTAGGSYTRSQFSSKLIHRALSRISDDARSTIGAQNGQLLDQTLGNTAIPVLNQWKYAIDASYELDIWGRVAHQYEAAKAMLQATQEQRRSVLIAQQADLAFDYLTLRGMQEKLRILRDARSSASQTLHLARERQKHGLVTELDVTSAEAQRDSFDAQIAQMTQSVAQQINVINLLLGLPPGGLNAELERTSAIPVTPPEVPIGLPSELAQRRPDIRQAEAQLRASVASVAEATAEFYPRITINADFGFQSLSFRDLGFWSARAWNVGPSISLPIFQGGRLRGNLKLTKAAQKTAAVTYRETVLRAWRDVDNALIAYRDEQARQKGLNAAVSADRKALSLARSQYRNGLVTYLDVLIAQRELLDAQSQRADSDATLALNLARLYNALGGGWERVLSDVPQARAEQSSRVETSQRPL